MTEPMHHNSLKAGHRLHWYRIEKVLGQGGFGITYLAHDFNLDHEVAIKEYLPIALAVREQDSSVQPASDAHGERFKWGLDRFMAEAQTLARFKHPNIVRVLAVFEANRTGYMVMEYEHGDTLHEILTRRQTLEEEELLNIVLPILGGLEKVHERGFIHRDIKPANIFIRDDGSPVLIDFGSARQALGAELTTLVSPGYAPFEQYYSKGEQQGPWTDIYGLGATLYRAVTGRPPQDALDRSRAILEAARDTLVAVGEIGQGRYSARFLKAIDHALQFRQKDRPQTVAEWRREFGVRQDARPNIKPRDSAMMAATIAADEPRSAPIPPAAPSEAGCAFPEVRAADSGMDPKDIGDGPRSASNPPAPPSLGWRTAPHVQGADSGLAAKGVADERRSEPVPPSSAPSVARRKGLALALVAAAVVATAAFWAYLDPTAPPGGVAPESSGPRQKDDIAAAISEKTPSSDPSAAVAPSTEDKEPNDHIISANLITEGATVRGSIGTKQDRDFFKIKPSSSTTRVILRKLSLPGFAATVEIYDSVENNIKQNTNFDDKPVTLSFESNAGSIYFIVVKSYNYKHTGDYELTVRPESSGPTQKDDIAAAISEKTPSSDPSAAMAPSTAPAAGTTPAMERGSGTASKAYRVVANPELKGRLGRLVVTFPELPEGPGLSCYTAVHRAGNAERVDGFSKSGHLELMPGSYGIVINGHRVGDVPIQTGKDTSMHVGVLRLQGGKSTYFSIHDVGAKERLQGVLGTKDLSFPVGEYEVMVQDDRQKVTIEAGKLTEF